MESSLPIRPLYSFVFFTCGSFNYLATALGYWFGFDTFEGLLKVWREEGAVGSFEWVQYC